MDDACDAAASVKSEEHNPSEASAAAASSSSEAAAPSSSAMASAKEDEAGCSDHMRRMFDEGSSASSAAHLPVLLPVPEGVPESEESWFEPADTAAGGLPGMHRCAHDAHTARLSAWPVHGTGSDLDLTGTWTIRTVTGEGTEAFHESADVEHSSFGHIASATCHGWFWGSTGYVQVILPQGEEDTAGEGRSSTGDDDDSNQSHFVDSYDEHPRRERMHVISLKFKGHSSTCVYLRGTTERGCASSIEFEVAVCPRVYNNVSYGDEATRDLTLDVQGCTFRVHAAVVATFMPHVRKVLDVEVMEGSEPVIPCPGDNPHAWHILLERVYDITGCFHASAALKVLPLLDKYQIPKLWSESVAELKRLPQSPRPHPHVLDLLCRCEAADVMHHWFRVSPPDPDELVLFIRECREPEAVQIVAQRAADRWRRESSECMAQLSEVRVKNRELQGHVDKIRQVVTLNAAPAAVWRLQTNVVPDFYIHNNLPAMQSTHATAPRSYAVPTHTAADVSWDG